MVIDRLKYHQTRGAESSEIKIPIQEFEGEAKQLKIYDISQYLKSQVF